MAWPGLTMAYLTMAYLTLWCGQGATRNCGDSERRVGRSLSWRPALEQIMDDQPAVLADDPPAADRHRARACAAAC